jgi:hypothetical protein
MTAYIEREAPYAVNRVKSAATGSVDKAPNLWVHRHNCVKLLEIIGV